MEKVLELITGLSSQHWKNDDDSTDRLSSKTTVIMLIMFTIIVSVGIWVGDPIKCWTPKHFTGNHDKFTNSYCWVKNTYYLPFDEDIPKPHEERRVIQYYQWIPFILLAQVRMEVLIWGSRW